MEKWWARIKNGGAMIKKRARTVPTRSKLLSYIYYVYCAIGTHQSYREPGRRVKRTGK